MSRFKVKLEVTGFKMEIEGSRDDVGTITKSIGEQFTGLMQPASSIVTGDPKSLPASTNGIEDAIEVKSKRGRRKSNGSGGKAEKGGAVDFQNEPSKYGAPIQGWSTLDKSLWLLHAVKEQANIGELSAGEIAATFNKHFKQMGKISPPNVSRDLGKKKSGAKALVNENTSVHPAKWYLTSEGIKEVQKLIDGLKNQA